MTRPRILINGLNYAPEEIGAGPYTCGLAEWFATEGHYFEVVTADPIIPPGGHGWACLVLRVLPF